MIWFNPPYSCHVATDTGKNNIAGQLQFNGKLFQHNKVPQESNAESKS